MLLIDKLCQFIYYCWKQRRFADKARRFFLIIKVISGRYNRERLLKCSAEGDSENSQAKGPVMDGTLESCNYQHRRSNF